MKIGYFADGPWAHQAFEKIVADKRFEIAFIVPRFSSLDPKLKAYSDKYNIPFLIQKNVNEESFLKQISEYKCDIFVSMSYDQILKSQIRNLTPKGFINCHAGALPFYRGRNVINWAIINGEDRLGITVHHVDDGIDTGDIIKQEFIPISAEDDYATMLDKTQTACAEVLYQALTDIELANAKRIQQSSIHPVGFYCSRRQAGDEWVNWSWPSERIHNFVRGICPPGPGARFKINGETWAITKTKLIPEAPTYIGAEGTVVARSQDGVAVKTGDTTLQIHKVCRQDKKGIFGDSEIPTFPIGTRLTGYTK